MAEIPENEDTIASRGDESGTPAAEVNSAPAGKFSAVGKCGFPTRMREAGYLAGRRYDAVKNALMSYVRADGKRVRSHVSASGEKFSVGRGTVAMIGVSGETVRLFLALDPSAYPEGKYHHKDMSGKAKYARCPMMLRLSSDRQVGYALSLIAELMEKLGLSPDPEYVPHDMAAAFAKAKKRRPSPRAQSGDFGEVAAATADAPASDKEEADDDADDEDDGEESASAELISASLPVRATVYAADGRKTGKVRRGVWRDDEGELQGSFGRDDGRVVYYGADGGEKGYVDKHGNVLRTDGRYIATLGRVRAYPFIIIALCLVAIVVLSVLLATCGLGVSQDMYVPVIFIADEEGVSWEEREELGVFENDTFGDSVIAPGLSGSYAFVFENRNEHTVVYSLTFSEINEHGIDMGYRLVRDGAHVAGHADYVSAAELGVSGLTLSSGSSAKFELQWLWRHDDAADTSAGENGATYTLVIDMSAEIVLD